MYIVHLEQESTGTGFCQERGKQIQGRVLLGLFRNRNTRNGRYLCSFGSNSVFGMNRMKGIRFTRKRQKSIRLLLGNFWRETLRGSPRMCRHSSSQVTSAMGIPFSEEVFFSKLKFRVFCNS